MSLYKVPASLSAVCWKKVLKEIPPAMFEEAMDRWGDAWGRVGVRTAHLCYFDGEYLFGNVNGGDLYPVRTFTGSSSPAELARSILMDSALWLQNRDVDEGDRQSCTSMSFELYCHRFGEIERTPSDDDDEDSLENNLTTEESDKLLQTYNANPRLLYDDLTHPEMARRVNSYGLFFEDDTSWKMLFAGITRE
jgi:hypothetical protein